MPKFILPSGAVIETEHPSTVSRLRFQSKAREVTEPASEPPAPPAPEPSPKPVKTEK